VSTHKNEISALVIKSTLLIILTETQVAILAENCPCQVTEINRKILPF